MLMGRKITPFRVLLFPLCRGQVGTLLGTQSVCRRARAGWRVRWDSDLRSQIPRPPCPYPETRRALERRDSPGLPSHADSDGGGCISSWLPALLVQRPGFEQRGRPSSVLSSGTFCDDGNVPDRRSLLATAPHEHGAVETWLVPTGM